MFSNHIWAPNSIGEQQLAVTTSSVAWWLGWGAQFRRFAQRNAVAALQQVGIWIAKTG